MAPPAKTNKKGEFVLALPIGRKYTLTVSAPGIAPAIARNIGAGMDNVDISVYPGDGRKFTEAEARSSVKQGEELKPKNEAELKKAQAEYDAKVKEVSEKNEKAKKANEIINLALKEGNDAYNAKNYQLAITKYSEGIAADPDYVGSAPIMLNNRGTALSALAVDEYNKSVKNPDVNEKVAGLGRVKKDFADSAESYKQSLAVIKNAPAADIADPKAVETNKIGAYRGAVETFRLAVKTEQVDPAVIEAAKVIIPEYLSMETDAAKKSQASLTLADMYRVTGDSANAIAEYKKILATKPDDLDAMAGAGLSLVNVGYEKDDKAQLQEGADLLQKYATLAPDGHKFKQDAAALIETLKTEKNIAPQKAPKKKTN
jgi:tetratricopeptide (TPR) repeat protein